MDTKDPQITVGGKTYNNLKDLPPELQSLLADENNNGIPDIAENPMKALGQMGNLMSLSKNMGKMFVNMPTIMTAQKFVVGGKQYDSWSAVPESDKQQIRDRLKNIDPGKIKTATSFKTFTANSQPLSNSTTRQQGVIPPQTYSGIPGVKHDKGRTILFLAVMALAGWLVYRFYMQ